MKAYGIIATSIFSVLTAWTASGAEPWQDPLVNGINTEPAHAYCIPYRGVGEAEAGGDLPLVRSLSGVWDFRYCVNPGAVPAGFYKPGVAGSGWNRISVPGNWQLQGEYDPPVFTNIKYPFEPNPPKVPTDYNPVGLYRRTFTVPAEWDGSEVFIHFGGVQSAMYLWVNGRQVGYHEDGMLPAEFNISGYLAEGENSLAVQVFNWSDGSYLEDQDFWRFSGIYRD